MRPIPRPATSTIAAQIAAQTLGPEFKQWLNDPQKLLQLIAAAEGAKGGGGDGEPDGAPIGTVPTVRSGGGSGSGMDPAVEQDPGVEPGTARPFPCRKKKSCKPSGC